MYWTVYKICQTFFMFKIFIVYKYSNNLIIYFIFKNKLNHFELLKGKTFNDHKFYIAIKC